MWKEKVWVGFLTLFKFRNTVNVFKGNSLKIVTTHIQKILSSLPNKTN